MMHHVLVENWEAEKAVEEAHKKVVEIYAPGIRRGRGEGCEGRRHDAMVLKQAGMVARWRRRPPGGWCAGARGAAREIDRAGIRSPRRRWWIGS